MTNPTQILITGAGGTVGSALARELAPRRPRLAFHSPEKAARAKAEGHDSVVLDFDAKGSLGPALAGVDAVFLLSASGSDQLQAEVDSIEAAKVHGVRKVVKLSAWGADQGAYAIARIHASIEHRLERSGLAYTLLRPNGFMQNFANFMAASIRTQNAIYQPAADARISHIDVRDIARVAAAALTSSTHDGQAYDLSGPSALSYAEAAEILSRVLERPIRYVPLSDEAARDAMLSAHMPAHQADILIDLNRHYRTGAGARVSPAVQAITGQPPLAFEQFVRDHAAVFA